MREYPAYGRTIAAHIVRGQKPICVGVLLSSRWRYFDHVPKVCIKPEDWAPGRYEFGYLRGMHVVAVPGDDCESAQLGELVHELMLIGPALLWAFEVDGRKLYDGELPDDLAHWARELGAPVGWEEIKAARAAMARSMAAAASHFLTEHAAIEKRAGFDAGLEFMLRAEKIKDQVRKLFAAQVQESGATAAA